MQPRKLIRVCGWRSARDTSSAAAQLFRILQRGAGFEEDALGLCPRSPETSRFLLEPGPVPSTIVGTEMRLVNTWKIVRTFGQFSLRRPRRP